MLRNLASSLFLTERDKDHPVYDKELYDRPDQTPNPPAVRGRVVTTIHKAKEVRSLVEKCITIARSSSHHARRQDAIVKLMDHRFTGPQVIGIETPPEHSIS